MEQYPNVTKIDLGAGNRPKEGFTTVDLYVDADIKADILNLPFSDGQIEAVNMSHVLEHMSHKKTLDILKECYRVMKSGASIYIEVPDFEWVVRDWVNAQEFERWGHRFERVFGLQCNDGEYHKTGFTVDRLRYFLDLVGFKNVNISSTRVEFHDFVLKATAVK